MPESGQLLYLEPLDCRLGDEALNLEPGGCSVMNTYIFAHNQNVLSHNTQVAGLETYEAYHAHAEFALYSQIASGYAVLLLSAVVLLFGLWMSFLQFIKIDVPRANSEENDAPPPGSSSISVGSDGFTISSPVIGLLILFVSVLFFYLYLSFVFEITEVGGNSIPPASPDQRPTE